MVCCSDTNALRYLGILQLNAFLYWLMRFSTMEPYYWPVDFVVALGYGMRVVTFLQSHFAAPGKAKLDKISRYLGCHIFSFVLIYAAWLTMVGMMWSEYGNLPFWPFVNWLVLAGGFNAYHFKLISRTLEV